MFGQSSWSKRISKKVLAIITLVLFLGEIGLIVLYMKYPEKPVMIGIMVMCILFMIAINTLVAKIAVAKEKKITYPRNYYNGISFLTLESKLKSAGFIKTQRVFGESFIKIEGKTAYKILLVENPDKYFDNTEEKESKIKGLDKCNKFIGIEIFYKLNETVLTRIPDFSFKGEKILYSGYFYHEESDTLVEANAIDVSPHEVEYNRFKEILGLTLKENPFKESETEKK